MRNWKENMTYFLIPVIASLVVIVWFLDVRQKKLALSKFTIRELISPVEQLSQHFESHQLETAVGFWSELAQAYGISPWQLRANDKLGEIVASDLFGDNGLDLEKKLNQVGIIGKLEEFSILELIALYVSHIHKKIV